MRAIEFLGRAAVVVVAALSVIGCTSTREMTPQQREGVELRRFCEQNPGQVEKCNGFLGWL